MLERRSKASFLALELDTEQTDLLRLAINLGHSHYDSGFPHEIQSILHGIRLPVEVLRQMKVKTGDKLSLVVRPEGAMLVPKRPKYALTDLIAQCNLNAAPPVDLAEWTSIKPEGREVW